MEVPAFRENLNWALFEQDVESNGVFTPLSVDDVKQRIELVCTV